PVTPPAATPTVPPDYKPETLAQLPSYKGCAHPDASTAQFFFTDVASPVTLQAQGHALQDVQVLPAPRPAAPGVTAPFGMTSFRLTDVEPGGSATVTVTNPAGSGINVVYKYAAAADRFDNFTFDGQTGAVFHGDTITLHYVDGGRGDADGV